MDHVGHSNSPAITFAERVSRSHLRGLQDDSISVGRCTTSTPILCGPSGGPLRHFPLSVTKKIRSSLRSKSSAAFKYSENWTKRKLLRSFYAIASVKLTCQELK